jgi:NitT/TauT family transport system permease protein
MKQVTDLFLPNKKISKRNFFLMILFQSILALIYWIYGTTELIPKPMGILHAWVELARSGGLIQDLWISIKLCFHALLISVLVSATIAYSTVIPFFRPIAFLARISRFLPMVGLSFVFTLMSTNGYDLKVKLLVFGMSVFIVDAMIKVVQSVTDVQYNHARTIFGNEWKVIYERVILGKAHDMFDAIRQNFAIVWTMLTFAEGLVRSDGGVGAMMLNENKHLQLDSVFAIQMTLFFLGILIDYMFGVTRNLICPYADLQTQSK